MASQVLPLAKVQVPYTDGFVTFQFGPGDKAAELQFIRGLADAADGRFTRAADR